MAIPPERVPPDRVNLNLEEALELLGVLEEAGDALLTTDHLVEVAQLVDQIRRISRKLGLDEPGGGTNGN